MRWMVVLLLVAVLGSLGLVAEPFAPVATLDGVPSVIGRDTVVHASARDRGTGLARLELRLVPQNATAGFVLGSAEFPRRSFRRAAWRGSRGIFVHAGRAQAACACR